MIPLKVLQMIPFLGRKVTFDFVRNAKLPGHGKDEVVNALATLTGTILTMCFRMKNVVVSEMEPEVAACREHDFLAVPGLWFGK